MPEIHNQSNQMEVNSNLDSGKKTASNTQEKAGPIDTNIINIGRPYSFRPEVDATGTVKSLLEKKMGIVEIVPCKWQYPVTDKDSTKVLPQVQFQEAIQVFKDCCGSYGLNPMYSGVRLHLTDKTASTDDITNSYDINMFQEKIDSMRTGIRALQAARNFGKLTQSAVSDPMSAAKQATSNIDSSAKEFVKQNQGTSNAAETIAELVLMGNKLSFPKIWRDSDYNPNININVRLFSPYGHPEAIKKFIVEPLCYIILLCSPKTGDGLTYGHPHSLHVRGYGMIDLKLAYASSISWRRGGDDSSFSIYRQPTTVDVSISLQALIGGFGYYYKNKPGTESNVSKLMTAHDSSVQNSSSVSFPTLGTIIDSFRPYDYHGG
ncbi:MAG: hypothetical protein ACOC1K_03730 [Nanoarchaeota archaeon]